MSEAEARAMERERLRLHGTADDQLEAAFLANVLKASGPKGFQAMRRMVRRLRREASGNGHPLSFTTLIADFVRRESASRGWL